MVDSVGKKLELARQQKGISVDEAARATKMRPDRIIELEHDDFRNFPNITYGRNFLLLYAKYLDVDVSEFATSFENATQIGVQDYEYLSNTPEPATASVRHVGRRSSKPMLIVLFVGAILLIGVALVISFFMNLQRLQRSPVTVAVPVPVATPSPNEIVSAATPAATPAPDGVRRATLVAPGTVPAATPALIKEVVLQPKKKTWVRIQRDDENSTPIFEDFLYSDARPLKVRGKKFWIEIRDPSAVEITKDGAPVPITGSTVTIE